LLYRTDNKIDNEYYLFYYQFVKWAFGFKSSNPLKDKDKLERKIKQVTNLLLREENNIAA